MYKSKYISMYLDVYTDANACVYVVGISIHIHICKYMCLYIHEYVKMCEYMYICINICIYIYLNLHALSFFRPLCFELQFQPLKLISASYIDFCPWWFPSVVKNDHNIKNLNNMSSWAFWNIAPGDDAQSVEDHAYRDANSDLGCLTGFKP